MRRTLSPVLASLLLLAGCTGDDPVAPPPEAPTTRQAVDATDRWIIRLAEGARADVAAPDARERRLEDVVRVVDRAGGGVDATFPSVGLALARNLTPAATAELRAHPAVGDVIRDHVIRWIPEPTNVRLYRGARPAVLEAQANPTQAPLWGLQWNMHAIRAAMAARQEQGDQRVDVAIIDSGVDPNHVELQGKVDLAKSRSMLTFSPCPGDVDAITDLAAHGTAVAGAVTTNNLLIAGTVQEANLIAIKALACDGFGSWGDVFAAILYAAAVEADVINLSLGAIFPLPLSPGLQALTDILHDVIDVAVRSGALIVAAAGNEGLELSPYPGWERGFVSMPAQAHPRVVVVSAFAPIGGQDRFNPTRYTNFGARVITVSAPGGDFVPGGDALDLVIAPCSSAQVVLPFTCTATDLILWSGTSAAAPHVAGIGALIDGVDGGWRSGDRIRRLLIRSAIPIDPVAFHGEGRVDAFGASLR